jgi:hypothetical protein
LDLSKVAVVGHSARAHAALWVASRDRLAPQTALRGRPHPLKIKAAVAIDGPGDVAAFIPARGPDFSSQLIF